MRFPVTRPFQSTNRLHTKMKHTIQMHQTQRPFIQNVMFPPMEHCRVQIRPFTIRKRITQLIEPMHHHIIQIMYALCHHNRNRPLTNRSFINAKLATHLTFMHRHHKKFTIHSPHIQTMHLTIKPHTFTNTM